MQAGDRLRRGHALLRARAARTSHASGGSAVAIERDPATSSARHGRRTCSSSSCPTWAKASTRARSSSGTSSRGRARSAEDAPLVDVETDKAAVTIPSPAGGTVVSAGRQGRATRCVVGQVIARDRRRRRRQGGRRPRRPRRRPAPRRADCAAAPAPAPAPAPPAPAAPQSRRVAVGGPGARRAGHAPPRARAGRRHRPSSRATGPGGRVTAEDVQRFAARRRRGRRSPAPAPPPTPHRDRDSQPPQAEPRRVAAAAASRSSTSSRCPTSRSWGPVESEPLRSIRRKVARKMVTSMILVPHVAHMDEADVTELEEFRPRERDGATGSRAGTLTLLAFVVKAVTAGLKAAPRLQRQPRSVHARRSSTRSTTTSASRSTPATGLVVPVIHGHRPQEHPRRSRPTSSDLARRARDGKLDGRATCAAAPSRSPTSGRSAARRSSRPSTTPRSRSSAWAGAGEAGGARRADRDPQDAAADARLRPSRRRRRRRGALRHRAGAPALGPESPAAGS